LSFSTVSQLKIVSLMATMVDQSLKAEKRFLPEVRMPPSTQSVQLPDLCVASTAALK
jgi:hypothetical protein